MGLEKGASEKKQTSSGASDSASLQAMLQGYMTDQTEFWDKKLSEWKQEFAAQNSAIEERMDELERSVSCFSFERAVIKGQHSSPKS